jgi:NIMA (never in mitosis gene a)-related kinase
MPRTFSAPRGQTFNEVQIIGSGAQGMASLVRDRRGNMFVVKEVIVKQWSESSKKEAMKEVHAMKSSGQHQNIIMYHDSWFNGPKLCILMEYAPNGSLDKVIRNYKSTRNKFMQSQIVHYVEQISSALAHCHNELNIIHRDIKPANIMIDQLGNLKLGDFGLSKDMNKHMMCATYVGSPLYMAPEIIKGSPYTFNVDIWSFGCVVFELMALQSPWETVVTASSLTALVDAILTKKPVYSKLVDIYADNLIKTVKWMLQKDPEKRATASELFDHFQVRPPPFLSTSILPSNTIERQNQVVTDAKELVEAASCIQRSFRRSRNRKALPLEDSAEEIVTIEKIIEKRKICPKRRVDKEVMKMEDCDEPRPTEYKPSHLHNRVPKPEMPQQRAYLYRPPSQPRIPKTVKRIPTASPALNEDKASIIQTAFRKSLNRRMPTRLPPTTRPHLSTRMEQLATPRNRQEPNPGVTSYLPPTTNVYRVRRNAWV